MLYVSCNFCRLSTTSKVLTQAKVFRPNLLILMRYISGKTHGVFQFINSIEISSVCNCHDIIIDNEIVTIGDVSKQVKAPQKPEYVPRKYCKYTVYSFSCRICLFREEANTVINFTVTVLNVSAEKGNTSTLKHLKWMLQKDVLSQDIFLIGGPGTGRRKLALAFLELMDREVEFIALSRDTTEADLKQRREIKGGTAYYHDQSAVRAATNGRVLIIEGVEKAERNVLPILNNLLENREMHLEDGRFLVPAARYDKLLRVLIFLYER